MEQICRFSGENIMKLRRSLRLIAIATAVFVLSILAPSFAHAQLAGNVLGHLVALSDLYPLCVRPAGGQTGDVGLEATLWRCDGDEYLWRLDFQLDGTGWISNVFNGKFIEGQSSVSSVGLRQ